jgi:hypothetical protein
MPPSWTARGSWYTATAFVLKPEVANNPRAGHTAIPRPLSHGVRRAGMQTTSLRLSMLIFQRGGRRGGGDAGDDGRTQNSSCITVH